MVSRPSLRFAALLGWLAVPGSLSAVPAWRTVVPGYPREALVQRQEGAGTVRVTTDAAGWVQHATMTRSTGSKILDDATLGAALTYWQGPPNASTNVPITYQLPPPPKPGTVKPKAAHLGWKIPSHPYPFDSGDVYEQGSGVVRATTDARGRVQSAAMVRSTGHARLDADAVDNARRNWRGPASSSIELPVVYRIDADLPLIRPPKPGDESWHTPIPNYPASIKARRGIGSGVVRVVTDSHGWIARAAMLESTGYKELDENTVNYALARWSGPPGTTCRVPISYRMLPP